MRPVRGFIFCQEKDHPPGKGRKPGGRSLQRRLCSLRTNGTMRERVMLVSYHCGFWTVAQYHKTATRSRVKSSGGAHARVSAAAIFYLLSAVVSADVTPKRRRRLLRRLFCGKRRLPFSRRITEISEMPILSRVFALDTYKFVCIIASDEQKK